SESPSFRNSLSRERRRERNRARTLIRKLVLSPVPFAEEVRLSASVDACRRIVDRLREETTPVQRKIEVGRRRHRRECLLNRHDAFGACEHAAEERYAGSNTEDRARESRLAMAVLQPEHACQHDDECHAEGAEHHPTRT